MTESSSPKLVRDLMSVGVATCPPDALLVDVVRLMLEKNLEAVVVLDPEEDGHALGVVTQDEVVRAYAHQDTSTLKVSDVMRDGVPQVPPEIPLTAAAQIMLDMKVRALFIMHHSSGIEYPAAFITYRHLMRHFSARSDEDLKDLGLSAERQSPLDVFIQRREAARKAAGRGKM